MRGKHTLMVATVGMLAWIPAGLSQSAPPVPRPPTVMVLDLDGDGFAFTSKEEGVLFDIERSGTQQRVAWTARDSDDVFLAFDLNKDGAIDGVGEMVGTRMRLPDGSTPTSGADAMTRNLQGLKYDSDGRRLGPLPPGAGLVDSGDWFFPQLMVWRDKNHDGVAAKDEIQTLVAAAINELRNGYQRSSAVDAYGNRERLRGSFTVQRRGMSFQRAMLEMELAR